MKSAARSFRRQSETDRGSGERPRGEEKRPEPRVRVLLFGCGGDDAQLMMIYSERIEITYLPSYDMAEVREEIERYRPKLILCKADVFLDVLPVRPSDASNRSKNAGPRTAAEIANPPVSRREMKILSMLAKGETNDQIAKTLRLSSRTVKRDLSSLFERLQVTNRTELANRVAKLSIFEEGN
jgi:DNA-binding NarL/FixJ family response regulator